MTSVSTLSACAVTHLRTYVDPEGNRAFGAYDLVGSPSQLDPVDLLAPAILQAPILGSSVIAMCRPNGHYRDLRDALEAVILDQAASTARFEDQDLASDRGPWALVRAALQASDATDGIKASKVTKILHRKRPHLVPIFDSKVARFYGVPTAQPWTLWPVLQQEVAQHGAWLDDLASGITTPDGRPLSRLRTLDIVVWEHVTTNCTSTAQTSLS